jgi:predicted porin
MRSTLLAGSAFLALTVAMPLAASAQTATTPSTSTQTPGTASGPSPAGAGGNTTTTPQPKLPDNASQMSVPATLPIVADTSGTATTQPEDGQVIVRLNGRFRFYGGLFDDQELNRSATSTTTTYTLSPLETVTINGKPVTTQLVTGKTSTSATQNKQDTFGFTEYVRLYPGFDGRTAGGLKYGASIEIRQDNTVAPGGGTAGSVSSVDTQRGNLYVRREWGYLGTDDLGTIRFGTIDDVSSLYLTGVLENFNDGGWNGDVRYGLASNAQLRWPFPDDGSAYETNKIVYLSPKFAGFDFGVSFEPSTAGANIDDGNCSAANTISTVAVSNGLTAPAALTSIVGCDRLESTTTAIESDRRKDTVDALLRYRYAFDNGLGLAATGSYTGGGHVQYTGPYSIASGKEFVRPVTYNGLSVADFGVAVTYAGLLVGGNYEFGRFSNAFASGSSQSFSLQPVGAKPASAWTGGASYTFGPAILGASWVVTDSAGAYSYSAAPTIAASAETKGLGQRHEEGLNAGGTLKVAPGLGVFLTYLWDERKQSGYDFVNSEIDAGTADPTANNKIRAQALTLGTSLTW